MDDLDLGQTLHGFRAGQKVFGRYTLNRILGRGGMGVVWLARDSSLETDVALKFLPEVVVLDQGALRDLKKEALRSRELTHAHIVRIHDFVEAEGCAAIAMEYIDGSTLAKCRFDQPGEVFAPEVLLPWVGQLAEALDYAHNRARVVHRDLKPANLMVNSRGELKVADFGISATLADTATRLSRTLVGSSGSPPYMSPQQMLGKKPAVADDVYALGATLYELLTGKPPFYTGNVILQVQTEVPSSMSDRRGELHDGKELALMTPIPPVWEETIAACLTKDPDARPASIGEVFRRLRVNTPPKADIATPAPLVAPTASCRFSSGRWVAIVVGLAVLGFAAWLFYSRHASSTRYKVAEDKSLFPLVEIPNPNRLQASIGTVPVPLKLATFVVTVEPVVAETRLWLGPQADVMLRAGRADLSDLPPGEHELTVQAPGHQPFITRVTVVAGEMGEAKVRLVPIRGVVEFVARAGTVVTAEDVAGRTQRLGTVDAGGLLTSENLLTIGAYKFRFEHADCASAELAGELRTGRSLKVKPEQTPLPGELRVFTTPPGAEVTVNGVAAGTTPATLRMQPSEKPLSVGLRLRGYRRVFQAVTLKPAETRTLNLPAFSTEAGALKLNVKPAEAALSGMSVRLDDKDVVPDDGELQDLEVGKRALTIVHPDYEPWSGTVDVVDEETTGVEVSLAPKPGTVSFSTVPEGAEVRVTGPTLTGVTWKGKDGQALTTPFKGTLPPGSYVAILTLAGHRAKEQTVIVTANREQAVQVPLEKIRGLVAGQAWTVPELGLELVPIAPGSFRMGSENWDADEKPVTTVRISRAYWLGKYEVTQTEWELLLGRNPSEIKGARLPVENVSWKDAMEYCQKLTERERAAGRLPAGYTYTLPTEAEWEYACRAGTTGDYSGVLNVMAWYGLNSAGTTHEVGQKLANRWGLYDMHGNAWEWCRNWYANTLPGGSVTDPSGASSGSFRALRGGAWGLDAAYCRSARRGGNAPGLRDGFLGFRVALSSSP